MSVLDNLTIIIPAFNEEKAIGNTVVKLKAALAHYKCQLLVINDASTDGTEQIVKEIDGVKVIHHKRNKGYGASLKTGIRHASTEWVAFYDADGQHHPDELIKLAKASSEADMVVGDRGRKFYSTIMRSPGKWLIKQIAQLLVGQRIPDLNSGLRIVKRSLIEKQLQLYPNGFSFSTTSTISFFYYGLVVEYIPINIQKRVGKSSVKLFKDGFNTIMLIVRLITLFNPLKIFMPISFLLMLLGVAYQVYIFATTGLHIEGGSLITILSGLIIFFVGILADQISAMRLESFSVDESK
jgi:glycosyltransferase involved in cell wall biosynthesis